MKKKIITIVLFIFINFCFFSEDLFSFGFTFNTSIQVGQAYEYVFQNDANQTVTSRLDWPILPATAFNANIDFFTKIGFHAFFSAGFSIPNLISGSMEDRDYENTDEPNMLTKFSKHPCTLKQGIEFNTAIAWNMPLYRKKKNIGLYIEPCIAFRYYNYKWLASNGYKQYAKPNPTTPVTPETPKTKSSGPGVEYNQKLYLPNIGIGLKLKLPKKWQVNSLVQICPQVLAHCVDKHFHRNLIFKDIFLLKGYSFHFNLSAEKEIKNFFSLFFSADYSAIHTFAGYTEINQAKMKIYTALYTAGTELYVSNYSFGVKFKYSKK